MSTFPPYVSDLRRIEEVWLWGKVLVVFPFPGSLRVPALCGGEGEGRIE